jgi:hypothetical protein
LELKKLFLVGLEAQIQALYDQLHIKDDQIEKLNENGESWIKPAL